ncbi:MAG: MaoC family dehydratase [Candidatus Acidiferrum sp.]|jgi:acyl dehydratase
MPPITVVNPQALKEFIGREIGVSEWLTVTEERVTQFAEATEDRQWIHLDAARASAESPYRTTIAHGFLTLALLSHFIRDVIAMAGGVRLVLNYGLNRVRFPAPVRVGARIRARVSLAMLAEPGDWVDATFSVTVESEGRSKPNCVAEWIVRYYP